MGKSITGNKPSGAFQFRTGICAARSAIADILERITKNCREIESVFSLSYQSMQYTMRASE